MPRVRSRDPLKVSKAGARVAICLSATLITNIHAKAHNQSGGGATSSHDRSASRELLDRAQAFARAGRTSEAEQICRALLHDDPDDAPAYRELLSLSDSHELPAESVASWSAQERLGSRFAQLQTPRFILFSDVAAAITRQNATWVERTHDEFMRFARECGLHPLPLQHKLVCVLFDNREEYLNFAQAEDGLNNVGFTGYYSPRHDRVVFSVDSQRIASPAATALEQAVDQNPAAPAGKAVLGFDSHNEKNASTPPTSAGSFAQREFPDESAAKCVHETIHQLMFHTGVMAPDVQYPLWICEGLSTAFETDTPSLPFGPDHDYAPRRKAFEPLLRSGELIPLRTLVTITELLPGNTSTTLAMYQQSYALVAWLYRDHREQLRDYLDLMRVQPPGRMTPAKHLRIFEKAFGDVDQLEKSWLSDEWQSLDRQTSNR